MKQPIFFFLPLVLFILLPYSQATAQSDSSAFALAVAQFHRVLSPENGLYNGGEYVDYSSTLKSGHPYFGSELPYGGGVTYDGIRYDHLQLWYDVVADAVVLIPPNMGFKMTLLSPKLHDFDLAGQRFLRLTRDSTRDIRTGFYELLYDGRIRLFRRTSKNIQENVTAQGVERYIYADSSYYLDKGGHFFPINRKKSLLAALADKRRDVQVFIRRNKISLKRGKDEALVKIITYYDGLAYADASR